MASSYAEGYLVHPGDHFASPVRNRGRYPSFLPQRRGHNNDGGFLQATRSFFHRPSPCWCGKLGFNGRFQQALGQASVRPLPLGVHIHCLTEQPLKTFVAHIFILGKWFAPEHLLILPAKGQQAGWEEHFFKGSPNQIVTRYLAKPLLLFPLTTFDWNRGLALELVTHQVARPLRLLDLFQQNIACLSSASSRGLDCFPLTKFRTLAAGCFALHREQWGQWFQSFGTCSLGSGFSFGLEGKVNVFQFQLHSSRQKWAFSSESVPYPRWWKGTVSFRLDNSRFSYRVWMSPICTSSSPPVASLR